MYSRCFKTPIDNDVPLYIHRTDHSDAASSMNFTSDQAAEDHHIVVKHKCLPRTNDLCVTASLAEHCLWRHD
jgi:hypothetical protein